MKKVISVLLLACMLLTLTACGAETPAAEPTAAPAEATEAPAEATEAPAAETAEAEYKLGMGVSVSLDSSDTNKAQVDATVATVVTDSEGKIVLCRIDCAQNKMDVTGGQVDAAATFTTKRDLKYDYNMVKYSNATLEWFEQVENLEKWVVGKTAEDIKNIETRVNEEGYNVAVDEELFASCSISLEAFQDAIVKACNDEKGSTFTTADAFTLGVSAISNSTESVSAADSEDGNAMVKMYTEFGAAAVGSDGKILAALTDAIQPKITVSADGEIVSKDYTATKRELGDDYNMVKYGNAIAEWDAQAKAFADYTVGKTADEVMGLETATNAEGYQVSTDETLLASCTMAINGMQAAIATAVNNAR